MLELVLQLTYNCQLRCKYCYVFKRKKEIPYEVVLNVLDDARKTRITRINLYGGEPLLYTHIKDLLLYLRGKFDEIILPTNGLLLPKYIDYLPPNTVVQVSIDGSREVTDYLRGRGVYDRVIEALECLRDSGLTFGLGAVYNEVSQDQIPFLIKLAIKYGAKFLHINYQVGEYGGIKPTSLDKFREVVEYYRKLVPPFVLEITRPLSSDSYCYAGCRTFCLNPDLNYVECPRYPDRVIGRYPELPSEIIKKLKIGFAVKTPCHGGNWEYLIPPS